jgi:hypothetical protein
MKQGQLNKLKPAFDTTQEQMDEQLKLPGNQLRNIWKNAGRHDQAAAKKLQSKELDLTIRLALWLSIFSDYFDRQIHDGQSYVPS